MKFILTFIIGVFSFTLTAQLQTGGGQTATQLVQNVLLGSGVEVSNVSYSGASGAIGTFNATNASIGIDEGIIMTTGRSEEHTSELQSRPHLVCRLLLEKKNSALVLGNLVERYRTDVIVDPA